jgi:tRNA-2-methylthio-N6-dimethylallyladenosine synthase
VQLLGQNVNAWQSGEWDFARLLSATAGVEGLARLRFTTSHPLHFNNSIVDAMAAHATICRFLHLPMQSGSDDVLKRMKRGYTTRGYRERIDRVRSKVPEIAVSTDIIVGFPGETEADFQATLDMIEEVRFDSIYSFIYSPRPGTAAEQFADDIDPEVKKERLQRLQRAQDAIQVERNARWVGRSVEVLVEGPSARGRGQLVGRTSQNHPVNFDGGPEHVGSTVKVNITGSTAHSLRGVLTQPLTGGGPPNIDRFKSTRFEGLSSALP